jgi:Fusaric acid resistance protein family
LIDRLFQAFFAFFERELAPTHRRMVEAARTATKSTITTALATAAQVLGPFGPLFAYVIGQPGLSLGIFEGALTIALAAAIQAAIVPITGKMLDYPGLIMAFLFVVFAGIAYFSARTKLFMLFALTAVGTISTIYVAIFEPGMIGWGSTYTFDGILVATLVMVTFDTVIWPSPPEPRLLESIAADLEGARQRLQVVGQRYLDLTLEPLPPPSVKSTLAPNLSLLESVKVKTKPAPARLKALLEAVITVERIYLEVERLVILEEEHLPAEMEKDYVQSLAPALESLNNAIAQRAQDVLAGLVGADAPPERVAQLRETILLLSDMNARSAAAGDTSKASTSPYILGFTDGLQKIAYLLEPREELPESVSAKTALVEDSVEPRAFFDPAAFRFAVKLGAVVTLALLVGLTTQRVDLQTILWSVVITGLPKNYGAVLRKTFLRLAGCLMGGIAALAAMLIVSQHFDSFGAYLAAIFAITIFSAYVAQSSEWLGYAGVQTGVTFLICYVGAGPTSDIYKPLWRFWGIVLGVLTSGFVFLFLMPEYAGDKLIKSLDKLLRIALSFGKEPARGGITEEQIAGAERRFSEVLLEVLNMADQARLEGRRAAANSAAAVETAGIVTRIAYRFEVIARARGRRPDAILPETVQGIRAALDERCCASFESLLAQFELTHLPEEPEPSLQPAPQSATDDLSPLIDDLAAAGRHEQQHCAREAENAFFIQMESYRRLRILLASLGTELSKIVPP